MNEFYYNSNLFFTQQALRTHYRYFADLKYRFHFSQYIHLHESKAPVNHRVRPLFAMNDSLGQLIAVDMVSRKLYGFVSNPAVRDVLKVANEIYERWMYGESIQEISMYMRIPPKFVKKALKIAKDVKMIAEAAVDRVKVLLDQGNTAKEIAEITGLSQTSVYEAIQIIRGPYKRRVKKCKVTAEIISEVKRLRSEGVKPDDIAKKLGIGRSTVYRIIQRERRKLVMDLKGKNRRYRKLTDADKAIIQSMRILGASLTEIANQFGCGPSTVHYYLQRLEKGREVMYYA